MLRLGVEGDGKKTEVSSGTGPLRLAKFVVVRPDIPSALAAAGRVRPSSKTIFSLAKSR